MKLYNSLTRQIEEVIPQAPPKITIYTCGPTVYDYPHIGNWFTFIRYDLLVRTLKLNGFKPDWVMNITDVGHLVSDADEGEDKLEKGARREGKTAWEIAQFYGDYFKTALERLNFTTPTKLTKATEHIDDQINLIAVLESKGFTYQISDGIYFDSSKFPSYADFALLDLEEQQAGKRVDFNPEKRNVSDFALWKFSPKNKKRDMEWDSPWGVGFPGWHIECSAMSMKYLGDTLDIHAGGIDHLPVHHTNEIAQSEAATGKRFANYWMHSNHITIEGEKISKSLGNGITLEDVEKRGFSLEAFRLHVLESHYRSQSKFSWESLEATSNRLSNWRKFAALRWQLPETSKGHFKFDHFIDTITDQLSNDLKTPEVLSTIDACISSAEQDWLNDNSALSADGISQFLDFIDRQLGLSLSGVSDISDSQKTLIAEREAARTSRDWAKSDSIRDDLAEQNIELNDTPNGTIWSLHF